MVLLLTVFVFFCCSEMSAAFMSSEGPEMGKYPSLGLGNSVSFKFEYPKGRVHRFNYGEYYVSPFQLFGLLNNLLNKNDVRVLNSRFP